MEMILTTAESFHCLVKDILPWDLSSASFSGLDLVNVGEIWKPCVEDGRVIHQPWTPPLSTILGEGNISLRFLALVLITV